jgi:cyanophycin synthetase
MNALSAKLDHRRRQLRSLLDVARWLGPRDFVRVASQTGNAPQLDRTVRNQVYLAIWRDAARELGVGCTELSDGFIEVRSGDTRLRLWQQLIPTEDPVALQLALHKHLVHGLLVDAGLPAPQHVHFDPADPSAAARFMQACGGRFVVKPGGGTAGGDGTTCGVRTKAELEMAARLASLFGDGVLIERQAEGDVYRLLFLDGELLDIVRRRSPTVVGDGRSTIGDLIAAENRRRVDAAGARGLTLLRLDLDCAITLREAGMSLASVPPAGSIVRVKTATGDSRIEDSHTYTGPVSERVTEDARVSASLIGTRMSGVDVITPDIAAPLQATGGVIAEVNGTPGLHHHYHVANHETATRVAVPVLRELLRQRSLRQPGAPHD